MARFIYKGSVPAWVDRAGNTAGGPLALVPNVVYTQAVIDTWATGAEYTRLDNAVNEARVLQNPGTQIPLSALSSYRDDAIWAKGMAVLWAIDNDPTRLSKLQTWLDSFIGVTSWEVNSSNQTQRLNGAWILDNMTQVASIIGYTDPGWHTFLLDACLKPGASMINRLLDWNLNANWHAVFAAAQLGIAARVADSVLWTDARDYFNERLSQSIYHSAYDGGAVVPLRNENGTILNTSTQNHWNQGGTQIDSNYQPTIAMPDGTNAERTRDHGHVCLGLGSFVHGAFTILCHGEALTTEERDRLVAACNYHASRMLPWFQSATQVAPWPGNGLGGPEYNQGWYPMRRLLGVDASADLLAVCQETEVTSYSAIGANNLGSEVLADA